jgi:ATP-binding cassette subfamily D (ALD) protein 3
LAGIQGEVVQSIVNIDLQAFLKSLTVLFMFSVPSSSINSLLDYLGKKLGLLFRKELTDYFNKRYIKDIVFYQMTQIDRRISNPDQRLTDDINKWSDSLASLYSNVTKPILDIVMFTKKLSVLLGFEGPMVIFGWYIFTAIVMKQITPPFGSMMAKLSNLEGEY